MENRTEGGVRLQEAIEAENLAEVTRLLVENPSCIDEKTADAAGAVPLCLYAAKVGNFPIVKYIVEYSRASMNTVDEQNRNILHYAAMSGNVELNRYLVEKVGMDITSGDRNLVTPYQIAWEKGNSALLGYYEEQVGAPYEEMYHNPIRTGMFPDPSIVRVGEDYYMVNSSFIFFPCIPVSHSKDLVHWEIIGHAITNPEWAGLDELEGGRGYWAPDISYDNGRFYITATYRLNDTGTVYRKQIVVSSDRPEGPYSKPAIIDEDGIDPSIFHENGRHYMLLNRGARIFELSEDCTRQISEASLLYYGDQKRAPEGPHLLKKNGYYYLFLAEGGTGLGHRISVARSRELMGNYEPCPYNPIMRQMDENAGIQRCGHGKPVCTQNGEWYMIYLCGRMIGDGYSMLGRETALDPITWMADGWPIVNGLKGPSVLQKKPDLPEWKSGCDSVAEKELAASEHWKSDSCAVYEKDSFYEEEPVVSDRQKSDEHDVVNVREWMCPRPPEPDGIRFEKDGIFIRASRYPLSDAAARNILLRRQTAFCFDASVYLNIPALKNDQEAGLTCYYDENTWVSFFVGREENYFVQVKEHIGTEDVCHDKVFLLGTPETIPGSAIRLRVDTAYLKRTFSYEWNGQRETAETLTNVYYLCDEGIRMGKRFTGAMVGIYACGGEDVFEAAFRDFRYADK